MNTTIWKFPIDALASALSMPAGAVPLTLQVQDGVPCLWALVDPHAPAETRSFVVLGTGQEVPPEHVYYGTWQDPPCVWHLFEREVAARPGLDRYTNDDGGVIPPSVPDVRTDNDFMIAWNAVRGLVPFLRVQVTTKQQAYRTAAWLRLLGESLPDEPVASSYDEVERAIAGT